MVLEVFLVASQEFKAILRGPVAHGQVLPRLSNPVPFFSLAT